MKKLRHCHVSPYVFTFWGGGSCLLTEFCQVQRFSRFDQQHSTEGATYIRLEGHHVRIGLHSSLIYIDDLIECCGAHLEVSVFADDAKFYRN